MKRMLVAVLLSLSLGLAAHQNAKADYTVTYPDSSQAMVQALSSGRLAFIFFDWAGDSDIFTTQSYPYASPAFASLGGAPSAIAYWLDYRDTIGGYLYFDGYGNGGSGWYYIGTYYL